MYKNSRRKNSQDKKQATQEEDATKLVRFAEQIEQQGDETCSAKAYKLKARLQKEDRELKRLKLQHNIKTQSVKRKPKNQRNKRLPPVTPSQPTMSQCIAKMEDQVQSYSCSQRHDYSEEQDICYSSSQSSECITTPNSKIKTGSYVTVTNEKPTKSSKISKTSQSQQDMVEYEEGFQEAQQDLIDYHESSINKDGAYDEVCPQCDTHIQYCHGKIFAAYCSAYAYQQFHIAPMTWSRRNCTAAYTRAYNRALDYIMYKEKGKLLVKAKFFPPACLKHDLEECIQEIEEDLVQMRTEERSVLTCKLFDNEKPLKNYEWIKGEIDANKHDEEDLEKMTRDSTRCQGCLLKKEECHNALFGSYCKEKVMRYADLYPSAMDLQNAEEVFLQKYQFALIIHIFWKHGILCHEARYTFPRRCLLDNMQATCELVKDRHDVYMDSASSKEMKVTELKSATMDYDGNDPDKV